MLRIKKNRVTYISHCPGLSVLNAITSHPLGGSIATSRRTGLFTFRLEMSDEVKL